MEIISVIVPVYNISSYLCQCVDSILCQNYTKLEIILVDDGSTDTCPQICDEYKRRDSRIKVIHKENGGLVSARKTGLQAAAGRYIGYVDGDDWIEPDMFERLFSALNSEHVDIAMCGRFEDTGNTHRKVYHGILAGRYDKKALTEKVYPNMIVNGAFFEWGIFPGVWDKLFRRECLEKFQMMVDERLTMGEDAACAYPALLNAESIYIVDECLYHYRQRSASMVNQDMGIKTERQRFFLLYKTVLKSLNQYKNIFDLTSQWKEYLLFLMTPRADVLLEGMEQMDYLFPFPEVKRGSSIILYGMGTYWQRLYKFLEKSKFCNVIVCADKNYAEFNRRGMQVVSPDDIRNYECNVIVVANSFAKARSEIYSDLTKKYPTKKIYVIDEKMIKSDEMIRAFGLADIESV